MIIVYVLQSNQTHKRYVGITNDLPRRIKEHHSKATKGGQLLGSFEIIYTEEWDTHSEARKREKILKSDQGCGWLLDTYPRE